MTGYGSGEAPLGHGRLVVELRAVNHRFLDPRVRLPGAVADHTAIVEEALRQRLGRGRVEASARIEGVPSATVVLDHERAREAYRALCALRDELRPDEPVPLGLLSAVPNLFFETGGSADDEQRTALLMAVERACEALDAMRRREGESLAGVLSDHLGLVRAHAGEVQRRCAGAVDGHRTRLRERLDRLLADVGAKLDEGRLEHEIAVFADKSDVTEEIERLLSHCDQFAELMAHDGAVGRKLDFLLQEMAREVNTLGSKSTDVALVRLVVELKAEIERLREQVQNVL